MALFPELQTSSKQIFRSYIPIVFCPVDYMFINLN